MRCRPPFHEELEGADGHVVVDVESGRGADKVALNVDAQVRAVSTFNLLYLFD